MERRLNKQMNKYKKIFGHNSYCVEILEGGGGGGGGGCPQFCAPIFKFNEIKMHYLIKLNEI